MDARGIFPIVATPFDSTGQVDHDSLRREVLHLASSGCHGMILFGVAGEFYKLDRDEKRAMIETTSDALAGRETPWYVSITAPSQTVAIRDAQSAESLGADGLMVLPPSLLGASSNDQYNHLTAVGNAVDIPLMIQYAPQTAGSQVDVSIFSQLADEVETISQFKIESSPPGVDITRVIEETDGTVDIFVGSAGKQMIEALDRGAVGVVPGASFQELFVNIYEAYDSGERSEAIARFDELLPMLNLLHQTPQMLVHYEKRILVERGIIETNFCREPKFQPDEYWDRLFEDRVESLRQYL